MWFICDRGVVGAYQLTAASQQRADQCFGTIFLNIMSSMDTVSLNNVFFFSLFFAGALVGQLNSKFSAICCFKWIDK